MGIQLGTVLISYDISNMHTEVKNQLLEMGYKDEWAINRGKLHQMPNTTLWKSNTCTNHAKSEFTEVCRIKGAEILNFVAVLTYEDEYVGI